MPKHINTKNMIKIPITIKGIEWKIFGASTEEYNKYLPEDTDAVVFNGYQKAIFDVDYLNKGIIVHELVHMYRASCCVGSASLDPSQREEVIAEIMNFHLKDITKQSTFLFKELKKAKQELKRRQHEPSRIN